MFKVYRRWRERRRQQDLETALLAAFPAFLQSGAGLKTRGEEPREVYATGHPLTLHARVWRYRDGRHYVSLHGGRSLNYGDLRHLEEVLAQARDWLETNAPQALYLEEPDPTGLCFGRRSYAPAPTHGDLIGHA